MQGHKITKLKAVPFLFTWWSHSANITHVFLLMTKSEVCRTYRERRWRWRKLGWGKDVWIRCSHTYIHAGTPHWWSPTMKLNYMKVVEWVTLTKHDEWTMRTWSGGRTKESTPPPVLHAVSHTWPCIQLHMICSDCWRAVRSDHHATRLCMCVCA